MYADLVSFPLGVYKNPSGKRVIFYFDFADYDDDVDTIRRFLSGSLGNNGLCLSLVNFTQIAEECDPSRYNVMVLDFGGMKDRGCDGFFFSTLRYFEQLARDNPSVQIVFLLTMDKEYYEDEEIFSYPNVATVSRMDMHNLIPYLGGR
jgi:hypothetical protein